MTTIEPFTQATSVTTSISVHGPAHEELDDVPLILEELSDDVELEDDSDDEDVELGGDELDDELLDDELLELDDDELVSEELLDEVLLELGDDVLLLVLLLLVLLELELELLEEPAAGRIHQRRPGIPSWRSIITCVPSGTYEPS